MLTDADSETPQGERVAVSTQKESEAARDAARDAEKFQQQLQRIFAAQQEQQEQQQQPSTAGAAVATGTPTASEANASGVANAATRQRPSSTGTVWNILPGKLGGFRSRPLQRKAQQQPQEHAPRARGPSAAAPSDYAKARREAVEMRLSKLTLDEESGTLCTVLDGQLLGTVEDSEFIRLRWWRLDASGARAKKLASPSAGFYQPTALDLGCCVQVEAWPRFAPEKRFYAQRGPLQASKSVERELESQFNGPRAVWPAHVDDGGFVADGVVLDLAPSADGQIERITAFSSAGAGGLHPVFTYEPSEISHLEVVLDDAHPRRLRLAKVLQQDGAGQHVDLTLGGSPDARNVLVLGLQRYLAPTADVKVLMASDLDDAIEASTSDEESDATVDDDVPERSLSLPEVPTAAAAAAAAAAASAGGKSPDSPADDQEGAEEEDTEAASSASSSQSSGTAVAARSTRALPSSAQGLAAEISRLDRESAYKDALIRDLREQVEDLKSSTQRESMRYVAETGKSLAQVSDLTKESERLRQELAQAQKQIAALTAREASAQASIVTYQERLDSASIAADVARTHAAEQAQRIATLEYDLKDAQQREEKQAQRIRDLELMARNTEQQAFDLQASLQAQINLRVESEAVARGLQDRVEVGTARNKAIKAKFDSLVKDVNRIVQLAGLDSLMDMEDYIRHADSTRTQLRSREAEKQDLLSENASLRAAMDHHMHGPARGAAGATGASAGGSHETPVTRANSEPGKGGSLFGRRVSFAARAAKDGMSKPMGSSDALDGAMNGPFDLSKLSLNRADRRQLARVYQLANSLTEQLTEKDEHLEQQRFANRKLAERVRELEIEATRWRR
ncbi:Hypothetical Protein FCC1311_094962 [Hondaea fermentalgiana]|uniref:Uncharacterized protein n=1 Tax=Hondaea fermentalgiana TaxID=2315210 RepID=A0A2R5GQW7_9STRA|nr:Hypothetical Protein FCC1311_094962 [Hondaea fermentalgiana]|eukprot:GBG33272.1 Hypothetical Protein FCC1311_094962 [Hondaea fermentalgiana]